MLALAMTALLQSASCAAGTPMTDCIKRILTEQESRPTVGDIVEGGLRRLHGRSQSALLAKLGYPDKRMVIGGSTVYSWVNGDVDPDGGALTCTIKAAVRRGVVVSTDIHGNNGACEYYARRFDPSFKL